MSHAQGASLIAPLLILVSLAHAESTGDAEPALAQEITRGGVSMVVELSAAEITTADRLVLTLRAAAPPRTSLTWPDPGEEVGVFLISARSEEPVHLDRDGRIIQEKRYILEPMLPGEHIIPALRFDITTAAGAQNQILTEPITLRVRSLLPNEEAAAHQTTVDDLGEIRPILDAATAAKARLWIVVLVALFGLALLSLFFLRLWRGPRIVEPAADQRALQALDELLGESLIEQQRWDAFFSQLTGILRTYIEARFRLHAPQQSTEAFLREARRNSLFGSEQVERLDRLLRGADLVKFAAASVNADEASGALDEVRAFVIETTPTDARVPVSAAKGGR